MISDTFTIPHLLTALAINLADAAAVAKAAAACAETGAVTEAMRIAIRLDVALGEAQTLHAALCLLARRARRGVNRGEA